VRREEEEKIISHRVRREHREKNMVVEFIGIVGFELNELK
jgi:hypothetical protein